MVGSVMTERAHLESKIYVIWREAWSIGLGKRQHTRMPLNFAGGGAIFISPPPVENAVTPRLLGRGRLPLEFIRGHLGVRQQPVWGETGLLSCAHGRAPECRVSRVLLVIMRLPPLEKS